MNPILIRNDALILQQSLTPGTHQYEELERALIFKRGIETLSNGVKVNTLPENETLLGGVITRREAFEVFQSLIYSANSLSSSAKMEEYLFEECPEEDCFSDSLRICSFIKEDIQKLIEYTDSTVSELIEEEEKLNKELIQSQENYVSTSSRIQNLKREIEDKEAELSGLDVKLNGLHDEISSVFSEIGSFEDKANEEQIKRIEAVLYCSPLNGFIGGLVTKRYRCMIPFYSFATGIISLSKRKKEKYERRLNEKTEEWNKIIIEKYEPLLKDIEAKENSCTNIDKEIIRLDLDCDSLKKEVKNKGKELTTLKNVNFSLKELLSKYDFLNSDMETIEILIKKKFLSEELTSNFLKDVTNMHENFLAIEYHC